MLTAFGSQAVWYEELRFWSFTTLGSCTCGIQGKSLHNRHCWKAAGTEQSCCTEIWGPCSKVPKPWVGCGHRTGGGKVVQKLLWDRAAEAQVLLVRLTFLFPNCWPLDPNGISWLLPVLGHLASNNTMVIQVQVMNFWWLSLYRVNH